MNGLLFLFGSGLVFFIGVGFVLCGVALTSTVSRKSLSTVGTLMGMIGLILIAASATPLPYWFYGIAGVISLAWLVAERQKQGKIHARRIWLRAAVVVVWLTAALLEIPYHRTPDLPKVDRPPLYVLGDSITAGIESGAENWPRLLARSHGVEVQDHSRVGATAGSTLQRMDKIPLGDGIVFVELGGNDLLGSTPVGEFERDLDQLLGRVCGPGRVVLLCELPLPPFYNEFGRVQRRLASKHGVLLVPKRLFMSVLTTERATVDSLHLSPRGHELMADLVWRLIQRAYAE